MKKFILVIIMALMLIGCGEDKIITSVKSLQIDESGQTMEDHVLDYINAMMLYNIATPEGVNGRYFWETAREIYTLKGSERNEIIAEMTKAINEVVTSNEWATNKDRYGREYREFTVRMLNKTFVKDYNNKIEDINNLYETRIKDKYTPLKKEDLEWFSEENSMGGYTVKALAIVKGVSYSVNIVPTIEPNGYMYVTNNGFTSYINRTFALSQARTVIYLYEAMPDILDWRIKPVTVDFMEVN